MKYKLAQVEDILAAFNSIQQKQENTNLNLSRLSTTVSSINTKVASQVDILKTQVYVFSSNMGWLGVWDLSAESYIGFINVGASDTAKLGIAGETGTVFLLGDNGNKIFVIDPYLPGITGSLPFDSIASFVVSPDGQKAFISQNNSSILTEVNVSTGKTVRQFTLPGTGLHLTMYQEDYLIYFSVADTKAVYSLQHLSGEVTKVFDLPNDAVKITPYKFGNQFGLLVLNGSGDNVAVTRWDKNTNTTNTVQLANTVDIVANPYTGQYYAASLQNVLFLNPDGTVLKTVALNDTVRQLTLTADGNNLITLVSSDQNALNVDTITGVSYNGPAAVYPLTQQTANLMAVQAQFGSSSN